MFCTFGLHDEPAQLSETVLCHCRYFSCSTSLKAIDDDHNSRLSITQPEWPLRHCRSLSTTFRRFRSCSSSTTSTTNTKQTTSNPNRPKEPNIFCTRTPLSTPSKTSFTSPPLLRRQSDRRSSCDASLRRDACYPLRKIFSETRLPLTFSSTVEILWTLYFSTVDKMRLAHVLHHAPSWPVFSRTSRTRRR